MNQDVSGNKSIAQRLILRAMPRRFPFRRGQSLLEMTLVLPILLLLFAGMIELGAYANAYLIILDATREAARYGSDLDPYITAQEPFDPQAGNPSFPDVRPPGLGGSMTVQDLREDYCARDTVNYYYVVTCLALQNIPLGQFDPITNTDDIVVTVVGFDDNGKIAHRWPLVQTGGANPPLPYPNPSDQGYHYQGVNDDIVNSSCSAAQLDKCRCWSLFGVRSSQFDNARIENLLQQHSGAPAGGMVIVEVFYGHPHLIGLFNVGDFIPDPIQIHSYTVFPVPAAEPTPTPPP